MSPITCSSCGKENSEATTHCEACGTNLAEYMKSPERVFAYGTSRFLLERVVFIATSGVWLAFVLLLLRLFNLVQIGLDPRVILAIVVATPIGLGGVYLCAYIISKLLLSAPIGSLYVSFREGDPIPDWFEKKFSWKRYASEFLFMLGVIAFIAFISLFANR